MSDPRTSSSRRVVRPLPKDSERNPDGFQAPRNPGREGMGLAVKRTALHAWVQTNLPDQHFGFAYHSAYLCWVENGRRLPTKAAVLAKLTERGKEIGQLRKAGLA